MTLGLGVCSSIEGNKFKLSTRRVIPQPSPVIDKDSGKKVYKFKLGIDGNVVIVEPLSSSELPIYKTSMLKVDDRIQGTSIDGWTDKVIRPGDIRVINRTSTHKGSEIELKCRFYAHVQAVHRHHSESDVVQKRHPNIVQTINPKDKD